MFHRRLIQLARGQLGPLGVCVIMGLAVTAGYLLQALLLVEALTALVARDTQRAVTLLCWVLAVVVIRAVVMGVREVVAAWAGGVVRARVRDQLVVALAALGPAWVSGSRVGATRATVLDGVDGLDPYYSRYLPQVVITALVPVALVISLYRVEPAAATVLAVSVALVLVVPRFKDAALLRTGRDRWRSYLDISADYLEAMQGMPTLRSLGAAERRRDALERRSTALYKDSMAGLRVSLMENGFSALVVQAGTAGAVVAALVSVTSQPTAGRAATLFLVLLIAVECFRPVRDLNKAWHAGYLGLTAVDGVDEILTAQPPVIDAGTTSSPFRAGSPPALVVDDVSYTYPGAPTPVLREVSFTVSPGTTTAVVGRSGAGKSTLMALLSRQADPDLGVVRLDEVVLPALPLSQLRRTVAVVGQHPYLFATSVADNIRLGAPDAPDVAVVEAARAAQADEFVRELPDGYATVLEEGGRSLSGGQRQRLALARALVRGAAVLVLDEATSHVDLLAEQSITAALRAGAGRRTCVIVAHRLGSVADVDQVVVLDQGRVVQIGPPAELAAAPGPFADLLADQAVLA